MLLPYLHRVAARENLSSEDARQAMLEILSGEATTPQVAAFLVALRTKGETSDELLGFALAMREKAARVDAGPESLLDTCGTGGDGGSTFNISTIAAFVAAGAGVRVAKHGNRSLATPVAAPTSWKRSASISRFRPSWLAGPFAKSASDSCSRRCFILP